MVTVYLVFLVLTNIRFFIHSGILAFAIPKQEKPKTKRYNGKILIQYPVMNEPIYLITRFIKSLETIPENQRSQFHLQVLDDYTIPLTNDLFLNCPVQYEIIRRTDRSGVDPSHPGKAKSKAGNMNNGLRYAGPEYKYVAIFDVDHQVQDFGNMVESASMLEANDNLWCVQSRWVMDNVNWSLLSILQQGIMNLHLDREQPFRSKYGLCAVMNGAGNVINLEMVRKEFGFWLERALTEDLDISFEFHSRGKLVFVKSWWTTLVDNPTSLSALRDQWSKWSKSNGQLLRYHLKIKHPSFMTKTYWLSWMSGFGIAISKFIFLAIVLSEWTTGFHLGTIEKLCIIPHIFAWLAASQNYENKFELKRFIVYPFLYILEFLILDIQIRSFWIGCFSYNKEHEFVPTPK